MSRVEIENRKQCDETEIAALRICNAVVGLDYEKMNDVGLRAVVVARMARLDIRETSKRREDIKTRSLELAEDLTKAAEAIKGAWKEFESGGKNNE